jgi:hypothetical protein
MTGGVVSPDELRAAAVDYATQGIPVLPLHHPIAVGTAAPGPGPGPARWSTRCSCRRRDCPSPAKHPIGQLVPRGLHDASRDPNVVAAWWTRHPNANIGLATGHVFDVLDIDGTAGAAAIRQFAAEHSLVSSGPLVRTGSGGWHYVVAPTGLGNPHPRGLDQVDWRGRGGYVVAPPSVHINGRTYAFVRDLSHPLPAVPTVLRGLLVPEHATSATPALPAQPPRLGHPYGLRALAVECEQLAELALDSRRRNATLYLAGLRLHSLAAGGVLDPDDVTAHLLEAAQRCGLDQREAIRTIASARDVASRHPRTVPDRLPLTRPRRPRSRARPRAPGSERPAPTEADRER